MIIRNNTVQVNSIFFGRIKRGYILPVDLMKFVFSKIKDSAGHPGACITRYATQNNHSSIGHIFTRMQSGTLHNGSGAAVSHRKTIACNTKSEEHTSELQS